MQRALSRSTRIMRVVLIVALVATVVTVVVALLLSPDPYDVHDPDNPVCVQVDCPD